MTHKYLWIIHGDFEKLSVCFSRLPPAVFPREKKPYCFEIKNQQELQNHEHEKDAHTKMIAIHLTNSSSTSANQSTKEKTHSGKIYRYLWIIQCGGLSQAPHTTHPTSHMWCPRIKKTVSWRPSMGSLENTGKYQICGLMGAGDPFLTIIEKR